jgi:hypothetical protein
MILVTPQHCHRELHLCVLVRNDSVKGDMNVYSKNLYQLHLNGIPVDDLLFKIAFVAG